jgi:8-oxo-dGTP pyrophosphatase MutT (NUDIX family)
MLNRITSSIPKTYADLYYSEYCQKYLDSIPDFKDWNAASLCLLCNNSLLFIKRSSVVPTHKDQIAFIGGWREKEEVDPWDTVQREWEEETSLNRIDLIKIGYLPLVFTSNKTMTISVVAELNNLEVLKSIESNGEWDLAFTYPIDHLLLPKSWGWFDFTGRSSVPVLYHPLSTKHSGILTHHNDLSLENNYLLWGATAKMVWYLMDLILNEDK